MLRRWIIRSICIALLTLCVTAWVGSYLETVALDYFDGVNESFLAATTGSLQSGRIVPGKNPIPQALQASAIYANRIGVIYHPNGSSDMRYYYRRAHLRFAGFALDWFQNSPTEMDLIVPLWFPTILSAGLLFLVWRKTRRKHAGKGFPVELAARTAKS